MFKGENLLRDKTKTFLTKVLQCSYKFYPNFGESIWDRDWDWLIVIDACRFDDFKSINTISGELVNFVSKGSSTSEWMKENFKNMDLKNVEYFSSNPVFSNVLLKKYIGCNPFGRLYEIWKSDWDEQLGTVLPRDVCRKVKIHLKDSNNRGIIHFLQPHHPFLSLELFKIGVDLEYVFNKKDSKEEDVWVMLQHKKIAVEEARMAYRNNIRIVLNQVKELLPFLNGKVVITSDHGNLFGEYTLFAHPYGVHVRELIEVPWLEVKK